MSGMKKDGGAQRLDKLISDGRLISRSEARELVRSGRVCVDGAAVTQPDARVEPERVSVDGQSLGGRRFHYLMLDKPAGVLSATQDGRGETVLGLLPAEYRRLALFPVGRLDQDTTGLLLLTNDGDFAHRVISPRSGIRKRYIAEVDGELTPADVEAFAQGLTLADGTRCLPARLELLGDRRCAVTVTEGKYHQVKRMLASRGAPVILLRRMSVGALVLDGTLGPGGSRELTEAERDAVLTID